MMSRQTSAVLAVSLAVISFAAVLTLRDAMRPVSKAEAAREAAAVNPDFDAAVDGVGPPDSDTLQDLQSRDVWLTSADPDHPIEWESVNRYAWWLEADGMRAAVLAEMNDGSMKVFSGLVHRLDEPPAGSD